MADEEEEDDGMECAPGPSFISTQTSRKGKRPGSTDGQTVKKSKKKEDSQDKQGDQELRRTLLHLANSLKDADLIKMKLFLKEAMGQGRLEKCKCPEEIFTSMEDLGLISAGNVDNLVKLLLDIERIDLSNYVTAKQKIPSYRSDGETQVDEDHHLDVQTTVKEWYIQQLASLTPMPWIPLFKMNMNDMFTNLEIVEQSEDQFKKRRLMSPYFSPYVMMNFSSHKSIVLGSMEDLANYVWGKQSRSVTFIEGMPGMGKSTLCRQLAYTWAKNGSSIYGFNCKLVILLEARAMKSDLRQCIFQQLFPEDIEHLNKDDVYKCMQAYKNDCLVIIDGLDEISESAKPDVIKLLQGKLLAKAQVVVTGRPNISPDYAHYCRYHLRITGFSKENSKRFIHKYFSSQQNEDGATENEPLSDAEEDALEDILINQVDGDLWYLCSNPYMVLLLCILVEEYREIPTDDLDIFKQITELVCKRYITNCCTGGDSTPPGDEDILSAARKLGFTGTKSNELYFKESFVRELFLDKSEHLLKSGLLNRDVSLSRIHAEGYCYFPHRTIQEFLCAEYIAGLKGEQFAECWKSLIWDDDDDDDDKYGDMKDYLIRMLLNRPNIFCYLDTMLTNLPYSYNTVVDRLYDQLSKIFYRDDQIANDLADYFISRFSDLFGKLEHAWREIRERCKILNLLCQKMKLPPVLTYTEDENSRVRWVRRKHDNKVYWFDGFTIDHQDSDNEFFEGLHVRLSVVNCSTTAVKPLISSQVDIGILTVVVEVVSVKEYQRFDEFVTKLQEKDKPLTVYLVLLGDYTKDQYLMKAVELISSVKFENTKVHVHVKNWLSNSGEFSVDEGDLYDRIYRLPYSGELRLSDDRDHDRYIMQVSEPPHRLYFEKHCPY